MNIGTLIVDDEAPARRRIRDLLKAEPDFSVLGEARDGLEAVEAIDKLRPQIVFLDIQMPGMDGFEVARSLPADHLPLLVFVTAYDQFALAAFDVCALDYLVKPFDAGRFRKTLDRLRQTLREPSADLATGLQRLLRKLDEERPPAERFLVKSRGRILFVRCEEIDWIEAAGNYTELHAGDNAYLLRETLETLENRLDPRRFVRIHRSRIVNVDRVREIVAWDHGDYCVLLQNGVRLRLSRRYKANLERFSG